MGFNRTSIALFAALFALAIAVAGCAALEPGPPPLTSDEIIRLAKSGETPAAIIERLRKTGTVLALSASEILRLSQAGVPREVLDYLQAAQMAELRRRAQFDRLLYGPEMSPFSRCPGWGTPGNRFNTTFWPFC